MSEYQAVTQIAMVDGSKLEKQNPNSVEGYIPQDQLVMVLKFECHYCHKIMFVDPNKPEDAKIVADMLKVQTADGKAYAFCDVECAKPGLKYFKQHKLVPDFGTGQFKHEDLGILLTDGAFNDAVESVDAEYKPLGAA